MNIRGWLVLLLTLTVLTGRAQLSRYNADFSISKNLFADSITIEWQDGQVLVPVSCDGRNYRFLLDTGSGQAVVYGDTPLSDCQEVGHIIAIDAIGRRDTVRMVALPPLTVGTTTLTGCRATVQQRIVKRQNVDGILGFDLVNRGLNAKIDVERRLLILSDIKNFFDGEQGYEMRYKLNFHVPYVDVNPFGRYHERVLFDTGSRHFYAMNRQSFEKGMNGAATMAGLTINGQATGRHAMGNYGAEPEGQVLFLTLNTMRWGRFVFSDVSIMTTQGGSHLGSALLNYGAVVFNPQRRRVRFEPYNNGSQCIVSQGTMDIAFVNDEGRPAVGMVRDGSHPYQQGFRSGDIIMAIDGRQIDSFEAFTSWVFLKGKTYRFLVRGLEGSLREVSWVRVP